LEDIVTFRKEYGFLSNFYDCPVEYNGLLYTNSEAVYQSLKTEDIHWRIAFRKYSGVEAKKASYALNVRKDWNEIKIKTMYEVCKAKFSQNSSLREKLVETYPRKLIQGNNHGDTFWGVVDGVGSNFLGRILMIIRDEFIEQDNNDSVGLQEDLWERDGY
jgi:ribA/ribD-fused uncharacterized protein